MEHTKSNKKKLLNVSKMEMSPSALSKLMSKPAGLRRITPKQHQEYKEALKLTRRKDVDPKKLLDAIKKIDSYREKKKRLSNYELTKGAKDHLNAKYAYLLYQMPHVNRGYELPVTREKGTALEEKALDLVSKLDGINYYKTPVDEFTSNGWLRGKCDGISLVDNKIVEIKVSYTSSAFLNIQQTKKIQSEHWYQLQGYLWLYGVKYGEIKYVLLNTPENLVNRDLDVLKQKLHNDEITRDEYDLRVDRLSLAFDYELIPEERRVVTVCVNRDERCIRQLKNRILKARAYLKELQKLHSQNEKIVSSFSIFDPLAIGEEE